MNGKAMIAVLVGLPAVVLFASPAAAQVQGGLFTPPEGCETYLTVQSRSCNVSNHFICPQIDPDHKFRTDFGEAGPFFTSHIDGDAQWIESGPPEAPSRTRTVAPITDPGSVSELIETGVDSFDFYQYSEEDGRYRVTGFDRIMGEVEIDGEPLFRTEFEMTRRDANGRVIEQVRGNEYVSARHKRFFSGFATDITEDARATNARDRSPVEFIYPDEPGFRGTYPRYDCDLMSALRHSEDIA